MSRLRASEGGVMSLFPFLAVLLCTIGALIVLLVVIARQARLDAGAAQARHEETTLEELRPIRDDLHWRIEQLEQSREKTAADLVERRLALSHIENHARQLRDRLAALEQSVVDLASSTSPAERDEQRRRLADLQTRIDAAEDERNRLAAAPAERSFAVVPYEGPHSTRRRPLYIECRADGILLQPENILLTEDDFHGPLGPGNPLAAALRAAREHLGRNEGSNLHQSGEPYPLLLVRPDGVAAYYAARAALSSWGADFGYEFIDQDWRLELGPPDATLARLENKAVADARRRQQALALAAPRDYARSDRPNFREGGGGGGEFAEGLPGYQPGASSPASELATNRSTPRQAPGSERRSGAEGAAASEQKDLPSEEDLSAAGQPNSSRGASAESLARHRGEDWGLRGAGAGAVGISRPIQIDCRADQLTVRSDDPAIGRDQIITLDGATATAVDELVSAIWSHVDAWGIAGDRLFWRPQLMFHVAPGGEQRFDDVASLLEGSGLDIIRRTSPAATARLPSVLTR